MLRLRDARRGLYEVLLVARAYAHGAQRFGRPPWWAAPLRWTQADEVLRDHRLDPPPLDPLEGGPRP